MNYPANSEQDKIILEKTQPTKAKIAFVHDLFPFGGGEVVTSTLATHLNPLGYQIYVFAHQINAHLMTANDNNYLIPIKTPREDIYDGSTENNLIINSIKEYNIDILIFVGNISFDIKGIGDRVNCKIIFSCHGTPFWEIANERQHLIKRANTFGFFRKYYYLYYRIAQKTQKIETKIQAKFINIYQHCDAFTVLCDAYKDIFIQRLPLDNFDKFTAISNAILPAPINYNLDKKKQLLYLGRMTYGDKRIDRLIDIWKNIYQQFPDWEFILVGDGEERANLEQQAKNYGLERIHFYDATNNPYDYYNNASILCLSSQFEGIPLVLLEAQQSGVIPIAFNCSAGVENVLSPNWENGVLINDFSMQEYEKALCQLMSNENLRQKMQQNVIKKAQDYDIEKIGRMWHELFTKLLAV